MKLNGINLERKPQADLWTAYVSCRVALNDQFSERTEVSFVTGRWLLTTLFKCWLAVRHFKRLENEDRPLRIAKGWS